MKIVISPAKSLNLDKELPTSLFTEASFLKQAETIQKTLKKKKPKQLMELMDISEKLADLNWQRNQDWQLPFTPENARPAMYTFDGEVYTGLDAYSLPVDKVSVLQEKLRILSGLYGVLKPFKSSTDSAFVSIMYRTIKPLAFFAKKEIIFNFPSL